MADARGRRIAIIGAGFSGSLLAVHLLRRSTPDDRIYLVERSAGFGAASPMQPAIPIIS
jgi:Uncharacterized protein conserved in bacteria